MGSNRPDCQPPPCPIHIGPNIPFAQAGWRQPEARKDSCGPSPLRQLPQFNLDSSPPDCRRINPSNSNITSSGATTEAATPRSRIN